MAGWAWRRAASWRARPSRRLRLPLGDQLLGRQLDGARRAPAGEVLDDVRAVAPRLGRDVVMRDAQRAAPITERLASSLERQPAPLVLCRALCCNRGVCHGGEGTESFNTRQEKISMRWTPARFTHFLEELRRAGGYASERQMAKDLKENADTVHKWRGATKGPARLEAF